MKESLKELARNFAAARVAANNGISLQYAFKRYVENKEVGALWFALAELVHVVEGWLRLEETEYLPPFLEHLIKMRKGLKLVEGETES